MNNGKKEHTLLWLIENYSYCWHNNGDRLYSPNFIAPELEGTEWCLHLFPRGGRKGDSGYISVYLNRNEKDDGPEKVSLEYELSVLTADGATVCSHDLKYNFKRGGGYGKSQLIQMDEVFSCRKVDYLTHNLTVCCKMWMGNGDIHKVGQSSARTRIGIEKISFLLVVENFTELEPNQKKIIHIQSPSKKECDISTSLYLTDNSCCEGKIIVETVPSDSKHILLTQKHFVIDGYGNMIACGEVDNRFDATRKDIQKLPLTLTRQLILKRKSEYLTNDKLSLLCECTFSTGEEVVKIEEIKHGLPMVAFNQIYNNVHNKDGCNIPEKRSVCLSALDDLTTIFKNQCLTDMEIKTKRKSFPVHKIILCARSSVFKAMLTNDMKEKNNNCIQVDDLEDDIVKQLLHFMYSDSLENLDWNSAVKLYYAGDKYSIEKLKFLCCSYLVDNISVSNSSELLLLADTHNDSDLKKLVEDFILKYEEEVFGSDEWEQLIETNPQLVIKTMHLKYKRKRGGK
ncbi:unnamed protein product [Larinioides sclopetarius]|uniref:Speckle-type POZ protein n=1 Tax=Larinioides sclopetarius TaxID=280406 RepID=A0AAV2AJK0_9ARAC